MNVPYKKGRYTRKNITRHIISSLTGKALDWVDGTIEVKEFVAFIAEVGRELCVAEYIVAGEPYGSNNKGFAKWLREKVGIEELAVAAENDSMGYIP